MPVGISTHPLAPHTRASGSAGASGVPEAWRAGHVVLPTRIHEALTAAKRSRVSLVMLTTIVVSDDTRSRPLLTASVNSTPSIVKHVETPLAYSADPQI
tara:strand:+ start:1316 stop:1612 length:297 start_codon:yes stop_codon:yes gene_type:complete